MNHTKSSSRILRAAAVLAGVIAGCTHGGPTAQQGTVMKLELTSSAFAAEGTIPNRYTGDGADASPPLHWSAPPETTASFALICDDPDAPRKTWVHWVLFNLPPVTRELPEAVPAKEMLENGARQGKNDFGALGYGGPAPPRGKPHRYYFKLYALDTMLDLPAGATCAQLLQSMKEHILAEGHLMGKYGR